MSGERETANVTINGERRTIESRCLADLLQALGYGAERQGIAVALNGRVVPRGSWHDERASDGDTIEIVGAVQGG